MIEILITINLNRKQTSFPCPKYSTLHTTFSEMFMQLTSIILLINAT